MAEILYDAPVPPDVLTYALREITPRPDLVLSNTVPITFSNSNTVRWGEITRRNQLAKYRSFDGSIPVAQRDSTAERMVRLAPFSNSLNMGEYERLHQEFIAMGGQNSATLEAAIYNDADLLVRSMHARVEKGLGQVLATGVFSVNENNFQAESDFGVPDANRFTTAVAWSDINAMIGDDLRAMGRQFRTSAGVPAGRIFATEDVIEAMCRNVQIVAEAAGTLSGQTMIQPDELSGWLRANRLPADITTLQTTVYNDETGQDEPIFPEGTIVLAPANLSGVLEFRYGLSATALELVQSNRCEVSFADGPGIVGMVVKAGPPFRQYTYVDAVGMPILSDARKIVIGQVGA